MPYISFISVPGCLTAAAGLVTPLRTSTLKRNWPSLAAIVFHDGFNYDQTDPDYLKQFQPPLNGDMTLTADPNNVHVLNIKDMLVFNN